MSAIDIKPRPVKENPTVLTAKQKLFVSEYLIDLNATQAAIRAGYAEKHAAVIGHENLRKPNIASAIHAAMGKREARTEITQDRVLAEYAKIAFLDPRQFFDAAGALIPVSKLPAEVAAALSGMDVSTVKLSDGDFEQTKKIKLADKKGALDSIARHLGMFTDKSDVNVSGNLTVEIIRFGVESGKK